MFNTYLSLSPLVGLHEAHAHGLNFSLPSPLSLEVKATEELTPISVTQALSGDDVQIHHRRPTC